MLLGAYPEAEVMKSRLLPALFETLVSWDGVILRLVWTVKISLLKVIALMNLIVVNYKHKFTSLQINKNASDNLQEAATDVLCYAIYSSSVSSTLLPFKTHFTLDEESIGFAVFGRRCRT